MATTKRVGDHILSWRIKIPATAESGRSGHDPIADIARSSQNSSMIAFRLPWYTLISGLCVCFAASLLSISEVLRWPTFLAGGLLLMDGGLGLRTLPALVPFASFPDDWRQIEREFYFGQIGLIRWTATILACTFLALAVRVWPSGDWQMWSVVSLMAAFAIGWGFAALKVIRRVLGNGS